MKRFGKGGKLTIGEDTYEIISWEISEVASYQEILKWMITMLRHRRAQGTGEHNDTED